MKRLPCLQDDVFGKFVQVDDERMTAALALAELQARTPGDRLSLRHTKLTPETLRRTITRLDATYLLRLFALFEARLRTAWMTIRNRTRLHRTPASVLIDKLAGEQSIPVDVKDGAHQIREYRNSVVHEGASSKAPTFAQCRSALAKYLAYLPRH